MHSPRFRMSVGVGATVLNLLLILCGYYFFGPQAAFGFGAFFGVAIFAVVLKIFRQGQARRRERRISTAVVAVSAVCGLAVGAHSYQNGLHHTRQRMREADRLADQLQSNARYELVVLSYHGPPEQNDERLSVRGYVSRPDDLVPLRKMVYEKRDWSVDWDVGVMSPKDAAP